VSGAATRKRWRVAVMATGMVVALGAGALAAVAAGGRSVAACDLVGSGSVARELRSNVRKHDGGKTICTYVAGDRVSAVSIFYPETSVQTDDLAGEIATASSAVKGSVRSLPATKASGMSYPTAVLISPESRAVQLSMLVGDRMLILTALNLTTGPQAQIGMLQRLATEAVASL
jgi:hypothetical protein